MYAPMALYYNYFKKDKLRDETVPPGNDLNKTNSSLCLALNSGSFNPGIILNQTADMCKIYFLHSKESIEVARNNILGNLFVLKDREVSYRENGRVYAGKIIGMDSKTGRGSPKNFLIEKPTKEAAWVSMPDIFLSQRQYKSLVMDSPPNLDKTRNID
ncbi:uncharacterized protein LOC109603634 [Aethina tumida]|uniref:uncharacterized protein LOC109603634 n=1 Tax=Aethina tumida TaxID=116153 RepID=UPI00096B1C7D|nr:uncharacterized protein LOC109603634 [Aethina tumida]